MNVPTSLKYADTHEWILLEGEIGTVGITDHAQEELTDIVYVEVPKIGTIASAGSAIAVVESVKAASDIYSPVSGEVVEVNHALADDPALVNSSPYDGGWLFKLRISDPAELDRLNDAAAYRDRIS